ncbi:3-phosphoshikimate 1-carboxyvinyltransferase [Gillisia sp. Hel_I_29]|uniref:3-phosphoshikimate 1-carboxyvinyltransferase n=1 Tax=Gillisia sp. Hel_I_29 TaxID=1249975 RepID=UPI00055908C7|nr:3-phosphoshikimate 1-carboxyvinyltransferase [Gillisia sp. Hel_I_29]
MTIQLPKSSLNISSSLKITGSKSESNRGLILQALFPEITLENLSNSDDTMVLQNALKLVNGVVDIHHAGTAMRFLTAYFAAKPGCDVVLTGSKRMQERPIRLLVEALQSMGAEISYNHEEGYPPISIKGNHLQRRSVNLQANISSQYISAIMLIAASLPSGIEINLIGPVTSVPYINMTLDLLKLVGIKGEFNKNRINIEPCSKLSPVTVNIESDWSSASYFYSIMAISKDAEIRLSNYRASSLQGDSCIAKIYAQFGVETEYLEDEIILRKIPHSKPVRIYENLVNAPDIAQTIAVTCLALGIECELTGLHTLKIKETDRLVALKNEMEKLGATVEIGEDRLILSPQSNLKENVAIETYNDHRMAMAFAPLALKVPITINNADVVSKSYPGFWNDLQNIGFNCVEGA